MKPIEIAKTCLKAEDSDLQYVPSLEQLIKVCRHLLWLESEMEKIAVLNEAKAAFVESKTDPEGGWMSVEQVLELIRSGVNDDTD